MTELYNHYSSEAFDHFVGHMSNDGVVYNHCQKESLTYAIGHVRNGVVYNHYSKESLDYAVGHVGRDGVVYNHYSSESLSYAIGHVSGDGVVYDDWKSNSLSHAIGHVRGSVYAGGAAWLLLNASFDNSISDSQPVISDEDWRRESAERQYQIQNQKRINEERAKLFKRYESNSAIVQAAKQHGSKQSKKAAIVTLMLAMVYFVIGISKGNFDGSTVAQTFMIWVFFSGIVAVFISRMAYKDGYKKKVWELGEQGFGREVVNTTRTMNKPVYKPASGIAQKSGPAPKSVPVSTPKTARKPSSTAAPSSAFKPAPSLASSSKPVQSEVTVCPYCESEARIPAGKGRIRFNCPNPSCGRGYEIDR